MLLYIDARDQSLFNPGKLSDYFGANRPVLGFTARGSEVEDMLKETGMKPFIADLHSVNEGLEALTRLWELFYQKATEPELNTDRYSVSAVCKKAEEFLLKKKFLAMH